MQEILEILGKKGTLKILEEINKNKRISFTSLQRLTGINTRTLSRRLKELTSLGIISREVMEDRTVFYSLTEKGKKLIKGLQRILEEYY